MVNSRQSMEGDAEELRRFTRHLLRDVQALEEMLDGDRIEAGPRRIGAEQEFFLVDQNWRPAPVNTEILDAVDDPRVVPELGRFNMELNADPLSFGGDCLRRLHQQIEGLLSRVREEAREHGAEILLSGILPTLRKSDLSLENMSPYERYRTLNEVLCRMRKGRFDFYIRGPDELHLQHDSCMVEAANTSFQIHFQVAPSEFARLYNISQAVTGPVLAVAVNSPLLFGKRLWHETRIALFQQSIDTRRGSPDLREIPPRVTFGTKWIEESVLEIYRDDISRFKSLFTIDPDEDPFEAIEEGRAPKLEALQLHNGTVYRWNRACYGLTSEEKAHLRIEFRALPSGPTLVDEIANAALWYGLVSGVTEEFGDVTEHMDFTEARANFVAAARTGMGAEMTWMGDETMTAGDLVRERLLPLARDGLREAGIDEDDVMRYLGVIQDRVTSRSTGAQWLLRSLADMGDANGQVTLEERMRALTGATAARQASGRPAHEWELAELSEGGGWQPSYLQLEGFMETDLLTVNQDEPLELVANLMAWHRVRYIPVEDDEHRLVGLVSDRALLRHLTAEEADSDASPIPVGEVMQRELVTAAPHTSTLDAIDLMRSQQVACLPVVHEGRLVGLVTERDFLDVAGQLLERRLKASDEE